MIPITFINLKIMIYNNIYNLTRPIFTYYEPIALYKWKKVASSTMKFILMRTSQKFTKIQIKKYENATKLPSLHSAVNARFKYIDNINQSKEFRNNSMIRIKNLNAVIAKESLFSFSFVRHPYTRCVEQINKIYFFILGNILLS